MILSLPLNGFVATKLKQYQVAQMARKDERVKLMNETLNGIKVSSILPRSVMIKNFIFLSFLQVLKLYAWEMSFQEMIQAVRDRELKVILQAAYMNAVIFMAWNVLPFLVNFIAIAMRIESRGKVLIFKF